MKLHGAGFGGCAGFAGGGAGGEGAGSVLGDELEHAISTITARRRTPSSMRHEDRRGMLDR